MDRSVHPAMAPFGTTVFAKMSALAAQTGAVNLGQGFPDTDGPVELLQAAKQAIDDGYNQYPPGRGHAQLREAVVTHQRDWYGIELDPDTEVLVTAGATEALAAAALALIRPGDEVVALEPYYDAYAALVALAGGVLKPVPLPLPDFALDEEALARACGPRTRMLILNSPHNPTGRVLTAEELAAIAAIVERHDLLVLSDEVYEHLIFDGRTHQPFATAPGMTDRTLTIGSAGKTFAVTGWKVGWVSGPADLITAVLTVKQYLTFVSGGPFQPAIADSLVAAPHEFAARAADLAAQRDLLRCSLEHAGFPVLGPAGAAQSGYFLLADTAAKGYPDADQLAWRLPHLVGVAAIPLGPFCADSTMMRSALRFAFCKRPEVLQQAGARLLRLPQGDS